MWKAAEEVSHWETETKEKRSFGEGHIETYLAIVSGNHVPFSYRSGTFGKQKSGYRDATNPTRKGEKKSQIKYKGGGFRLLLEWPSGEDARFPFRRLRVQSCVDKRVQSAPGPSLL